VPPIPFSVLDLSPIVEGGDAAQALRNTQDLARHAEQWGYRRYWLAEHHNMPGIASAATAVVIAAVGAATSTIRVGAGGIMLPNHAPLVVAEQFGTLECLFPGRIDLGVGRAPGTDQTTAAALRRHGPVDADDFPRELKELVDYFRPAQPGQSVRAVPGTGLRVPIWILGSSLFGAQVAAAFGLPYAFASHFAPADMMDALALYRAQFRPSDQLERPYVMLGVNVFVADTAEEASRLFTSVQQAFVRLRRGEPSALPPPVANLETLLSPREQTMLRRALACSFIGTTDTVRRGLESFVATTAADELIVVSQIYDHDARLRSYERTASLAFINPAGSFRAAPGDRGVP
jgi:luciferase family oxidoreductase group 1